VTELHQFPKLLLK